MTRHFSTPLLVVSLATATFLATPASTATDPGPYTVHEWGTFTSIAGPDGNATEWLPQTGPSDLPCFVRRSLFNAKGSLPGTVRMETPVLYFYTDRPITMDVSVRFRDGLITEWFPPAQVTPDSFPIPPNTGGSIRWQRVTVSPGAPEDFPIENTPSHYYAARRTNAVPLQAGPNTEKFLFYRGVGRIALPIAATVGGDGKVAVKNSGDLRLGDVILFKNERGHIAYDVLRDLTTVDPPVEGQEPTTELERMLEANGLYAEEARAMIDTWRDSWFEDGTRLIYIVPRPVIDAELPLTIAPPPADTARVFVGRMELVTPSIVNDIRTALLADDRATLHRYSRFLDAMGRRVIAESAPDDRERLTQQLRRLNLGAISTPACR
jgi:hypothetical protein